MSFLDVKCPACDRHLEVEAMHADGATYSCPCGRTRMTSLLEGKLEQLELPPADLGLVPDEAPGPWERGDHTP